MIVTQRVSHVSLHFRVLDDGANPISMIDDPKLLFKFIVEERRRPAVLTRPWLTTLEVEHNRTLLKSFTTEHFEIFFHERMNSCVQNMLSSIEILQPNSHEYLQKLIADRVCDKAMYLSTTDPMSMNITVDIKLDTTEVYEEGDDDEHEEISDFIRESMEVDLEFEVKMKPTSRDAIEALEKVVIERADSLQACVVCFDEFLEGREVKMMPCFHIFHGDCIAQWLGKSNNCPLCRFEMPL